MTDHTYCYTTAIKHVQAALRDGVIGDLQYIDSTRVSLGLVRPDIDVFWDLAPHDLSILDFILPDGCTPLSVAAQSADPIGAGLACIGYLTLQLPDDVIAHINVNWLSPRKIRTTVIGGSRRMVVWDDVNPAQRLSFFDTGVDMLTPTDDERRHSAFVSYRSGDMVAPALQEIEALTGVIDELAAAIRQHRAPITDGAAGVRVVRILEAVSRSIECNGRPRCRSARRPLISCPTPTVPSPTSRPPATSWTSPWPEPRSKDRRRSPVRLRIDVDGGRRADGNPLDATRARLGRGGRNGLGGTAPPAPRRARPCVIDTRCDTRDGPTGNEEYAVNMRRVEREHRRLERGPQPAGYPRQADRHGVQPRSGQRNVIRSGAVRPRPDGTEQRAAPGAFAFGMDGEGCDIDQAPPGGCGAVSASATAPSTWVPAVLAAFCVQPATSVAKRPVGHCRVRGAQRAGLYAGFCSDRGPRWPSIWAAGYPTARAAYPGFNGRAVLTLLGLAPGGVCRATRVTPGAGALLPHRFTLTCAPGEAGRHRRSALCCTVLRVAPTGCYPAPCPVESGRSSDRSSLARGHPADSLRRPVYQGREITACGEAPVRFGGRPRAARSMARAPSKPPNMPSAAAMTRWPKICPGRRAGEWPREQALVLVAHEPDDDPHGDPEHERADARRACRW